MEDAQQSLGAELRRLRQEAGFTLQEVADATWQLPTGPHGAVSNPYLSMLESGHRTNISYPKLWALSGVYGVPISRLLEFVDDAGRRRLDGERAESERAGLIRPYVLSPSLMRLRSKQLLQPAYALLVRRAKDTSIAIGDEDLARELVPMLVGGAACLPGIFANSPAAVVSALRLPGGAILSALGVSRAEFATACRELATDAIECLLASPPILDVMSRCLESWTMDFERYTLSVTFRSDSPLADFSFRELPAFPFEEAARAYIATAIWPLVKGRDSLPQPPRPLDAAVLEVTTFLFNPAYHSSPGPVTAVLGYAQYLANTLAQNSAVTPVAHEDLPFADLLPNLEAALRQLVSLDPNVLTSVESGHADAR